MEPDLGNNQVSNVTSVNNLIEVNQINFSVTYVSKSLQAQSLLNCLI